MNRVLRVLNLYDDVVQKKHHGYTVVMFNTVNQLDIIINSKNSIDGIKICNALLFMNDDELDNVMKVFKTNNFDIYCDSIYVQLAINRGILDDFLRILKLLQVDYIELDVSSEKDISILESLINRNISIIPRVVRPCNHSIREVIEKTISIVEKLINLRIELIELEGGYIGKNTLLYDSDGKVMWQVVYSLLDKIAIENLLFEAPSLYHQAQLIHELGSNVKISGVRPEEVLILESMRYGIGIEKFIKEELKLELPPSAKFVLYALKRYGPMDSNQLSSFLGIPGRTVREAVKVLQSLGLIREVKRVGKRRVWKTI